MGQAMAKHVDTAWSPCEADVGRMRQQYLHRLGIERSRRTRPRSVGSTLSDELVPDRTDAPADAPEASAGPQVVLPNLLTPSPLGGKDADNLGRGGRDDFRTSFLRKLSYQRVWVPAVQRPPQHQTVVIFDWDDTLLPTTFLQARQHEALDAITEYHLRGIERAATLLLQQALGTGRTFIVTNAMPGWVEYSAARFAPGLLPALQRVRVISARGKYEAEFPEDVGEWKVRAFLEVQRQLDAEMITNVISLGDSELEMDAAHKMGQGFAKALIKTIKFREHPSPEQVCKQLQLVEQKFQKVAQSAMNLKIGLSHK